MDRKDLDFPYTFDRGWKSKKIENSFIWYKKKNEKIENGLYKFILILLLYKKIEIKN